jgi:hypothetical protein
MTRVSAMANEASTVLRDKIDLLRIAARQDTGERRLHTRVVAHGVTVTVRLRNAPAVTVALRDLSHSGAAIFGEWTLPPGHEVDLDLPNGGGFVSGRVVRCKGGFLVLVFQQDPTTKDLVSRAMESLAGVAALRSLPEVLDGTDAVRLGTVASFAQ